MKKADSIHPSNIWMKVDESFSQLQKTQPFDINQHMLTTTIQAPERIHKGVTCKYN